MSQKQSVVLVLGTGHCGSTLVDLVLGSHATITSLGELRSLNDQTRKGKEEFWNDNLISKIKKHYKFKKNRIISYDFHKFPRSKIFENRINLYRNISDETKSEILVDSSKNLFWIRRSALHLNNSSIQPILIHIKRNPCAVVNSYYRKYKGKRSFHSIIENIKMRIDKNNQFYNTIPGIKKTILNYEEFCLNPEEKTRRLCVFLNLEYQKNMLKYWEYEHFNLSGNSGTNSLIKKFQEEEIKVNNKREDLSHYQEHPLSIKLDERWKKELTMQQVEEIKNIMPSY